MVPAVFLIIGVVVLICALASAERVPHRLTRPVRPDDDVKLQSRAHVFAEAKVLRVWTEGATVYIEAQDALGERFIRPLDLVERI